MLNHYQEKHTLSADYQFYTIVIYTKFKLPVKPAYYSK